MSLNQSAPSSESSISARVTPPQHFEVDRYVDKFLSTMCDSSRRRILELLSYPKGQKLPEDVSKIVPIECRSTDIAKLLNLSPATTSGHLKQMASTGIVISRREGNAIYYSLNNHYLVHAFRDLLLALDKHYHANVKNTDLE